MLPLNLNNGNLNNTCEIVFRMNDLILKSKETVITSNIYILIYNISKEPSKVFLIYNDKNYFRGRYKIEGEFIAEKKLWEGKLEDVPLYPESGTILQFPFDNLKFNFKLEILSYKSDNEAYPIILSKVKIYNHFSSFTLLNNGTHLESNNNIKIILKRSIYSKVFLVSITLLIFFFVLSVILNANKLEHMVISLIAFFVSIFPIKIAANNLMVGYITLVDIIFLFISYYLLSIIVISYLTSKPKEN